MAHDPYSTLFIILSTKLKIVGALTVHDPRSYDWYLTLHLCTRNNTITYVGQAFFKKLMWYLVYKIYHLQTTISVFINSIGDISKCDFLPSRICHLTQVLNFLTYIWYESFLGELLCQHEIKLGTDPWDNMSMQLVNIIKMIFLRTIN